MTAPRITSVPPAVGAPATPIVAARRGARLEKLEAIRGFAATYVFIVHAVKVFFPDLGRWNAPFRLGTEAVILFFIMSGFVIYFSVFGAGRTETFRAYFIKRVRRIYPIFVLSLMLAWGVQSFIARQPVPPDGVNLAGNLAMLQSFDTGRGGVWFTQYQHNGTLWSLAYEWWYYMLFFPLAGLALVKPRVQPWAALAISIAATLVVWAAPNPPALYLAWLAIWWSGVELAREYIRTGRLTMRAQAPSIVALALLLAMWLGYAATHRELVSIDQLGRSPMNDIRAFAFSLCVLVGGLVWYSVGFPGFRWIFGWFTPLAPISYGLYVFHFPILQGVQDTLGGRWPILGICVSLTLVVLLAYLAEVRLQRVINRATAVLLR
ncbi:hypothetical protein BH11PLA1_BH11PLA1_13470 [soil metagenome]